MKLHPDLKAWLLKADPRRPDPDGLREQQREELVRTLEDADEDDLKRMAEFPKDIRLG